MLEEQHISNPVEQLHLLYKKVVENPCFDQYAIYENSITRLFDCIKQRQFNESDRLLLAEIREMHEQVICAILAEKNNLSMDMDLLERKKRASDHYGRISNYNASAFFVDFKK